MPFFQRIVAVTYTFSRRKALSPIIQLSGVTKQYGGFRALDDAAVRVEPGITGLLGPNGSGKSTLIKAILGLVRSQQGSGTVLGLPWPEQVREIRDLVGYLPEDDCYIAGLTGIEAVAFMANLSGLPRVEGLRRAHEITDFCDIGEEKYRPVESYSTGMRQKLKFAQALVHDPPFLILDEPTTGLDPDQREAMLRRIRTLANDHGKSILLSTHILPDVKAVCDQVIILARGQVRVIDSLHNLSKPAEPTLNVVVYGESKAFLSGLSEAGHEVVSHADGTLKIAGIGTDQVSTIWDLAATTGTSIRRLVPAQNSLEEIFFQAVSTAEAN
ncbi:MAG: ABC transporter ATP-binding protein [Rubripirellula sp.]|nr:ABC transporter ATP-binding protein [Rubripirellula sp.]